MNVDFGKHHLVRAAALFLFAALFLLSACSQNGSGAGIQNSDDESVADIQKSDDESAANAGNSSDNLSPSENLREPALAENEMTEPTQPSEEPMYIKRLKAVLHDEATFLGAAYHEDKKISQLSSSDDVTIEAIKMAVVDLDDDGRKEVILQEKVNGDEYFGFLILRYQDDIVYGYSLWYRTFYGLKEDGSFFFSGGVADHGFGTIQFDADTYTKTKVAYSESGYDDLNNFTVSFYVNGESATESQYDSAIAWYNSKADVQWYDITDDNIDQLLTES